MEDTRTAPTTLLPTLIVGLGALLVFTSTLSFFPFPGESAAMLVRYGGLDPLPTAYHPLYALVAQCFAALPVGTLAFRIGLISALCGAACVAILFVMVSNLDFRQVHDDEAPLLPFVAGLPAAAYLLLAPPFWASANRAHPILFHLCLLLTALMLLQRYGQTGRLRCLGVAAFILGLFLLEWAGNMLVLPFVIAGAVLYLRGNGHLREESALVPVVAFTLGVVTFIAIFYGRLAWATANLVDPPEFHLASAMFTLVGEHLFVLERAFQGVDLVLIAIGSIVPWLVAMVCARQESDTEAYSGALILHIVLTLLCLILLFLGTVSPGMLNDLHNLAAVPPVVAIASVFGYVVGYWYILADRAWGEKPVVMTKVLVTIGVAVSIMLLTSVKVNSNRTSTRLAEATHQWAAALLLPLPVDSVVIAPASEQNLLTVTAREQSHSIRPIDLSRAEDPEYRSYIADTLAPEELRDLAEHSMPRFIEAWMRHPDYPAGHVLTTAEPTPFARAGRSYEPTLTGYRDRSDPITAWHHDRLKHHQSFWNRVVPALRTYRTTPGFPGSFCRRLVRKASRTANDLALLAREHDAFNDAHIALQAAGVMDLNNPYAAANHFLLLTQTGQSEEAANHWNSINTLITSDDLSPDRTEDGTLLGADRLCTFARIRPAPRNPLPDSGVFRDALAHYLLAETSELESLSPTLTLEHPTDPDAWTLAGLMAVDIHDTNRFVECTTQLTELNIDTIPLLITAAQEAANQDNISWAQQLMADAVARQPADIGVLETIAGIELLASTPATQAVYLHRLLSLDPDNALGHYALGARYLSAGERGRARQELVAAANRGDDPRAVLLAALLTDQAGGLVPHKSERLARRAIDADIDDPNYWNALKDLLGRVDFPAAALYAAGQAERPPENTPTSRAFARLLEAARPVEVIEVAAAKREITPAPAQPQPVNPGDADIRTLLNQVVHPEQTEPPPPAAPALEPPPEPPPPPAGAANLDDEEAPVPLVW